MTEQLKLNPAAVGLTLLAPSGCEISGTHDMVIATAHASSVAEDGAAEYDGGSHVWWDSQKSLTAADGETLWADDDGLLWRQSQLRAWVEGDADEEGRSIPLYLPEDSARNGDAAKPFDGVEVYEGRHLVDAATHIALKARIAALEAGLRLFLPLPDAMVALERAHPGQSSAVAALVDGAPAAEVVAAKPRIVIVMEGGLVQAVMGENADGVEVARVDWDTEGADEDDLTQLQDGQAFVAGFNVDDDPAYVQDVFAAIEREG